MSVLMVAAAVLITAAIVGAVHRRTTGRAPALTTPVIDARTDQELRTRYLNGEIGIDTYLDRRFGTAFSSAGQRRPAG
jgi:hypothetical protein